MYAVKHSDIKFFFHAIREICIIFQALLAGKPKYAQKLLKQLHKIDTNAADPVLQEVHLVNKLVNSQDFPETFYNIGLLLKHQNGKFKRFQINQRWLLQKFD